MSKLLKLASVAALAFGLAATGALAAGDHRGGGGGGGRAHIGGGGGGGGFKGGGNLGGGAKVFSAPRSAPHIAPAMPRNRPNIGGGFNQGPRVKHFNGQNQGAHQGRRHHGRRIIIGAPYYSYYDNYAYADDTCRYYWQRYLRTGNYKWKRRYEACIDD